MGHTYSIVQLEFSYPRYLEAKRSVDDRALNRVVLQSLKETVAHQDTNAGLRVLEIGGGTGTMLRRLADWGVLARADYTLVDVDKSSLAALPATAPPGFRLNAVHSDISDFLSRCEARFDLVIAHAVLDLIDLEQFLPLLWSRCSDDANFWFTINFDGESAFLPELADDQEIWNAYHASMNERPGSSHAGRKLFAHLATSGATIESSGSSDWVVHPKHGAYPEQEDYFLHHIIHTIDNELRGHAPVAEEAFADWVSRRHAQVEAAELVYLAHQLDFFGTAP